MGFKTLFNGRVEEKKEITIIRPDLALVVLGGVLTVFSFVILIFSPKPRACPHLKRHNTPMTYFI